MGARPGHDAQGCWARHDQLTNATLAASFGIGFSDDRGPVVLIVLVVLVVLVVQFWTFATWGNSGIVPYEGTGNQLASPFALGRQQY